jgi:threonine aldolase
MIDLRSDTITKPSDAMRQAIAQAEVGDDVFGDDPSVIELERRAAQLLGKEAAVFVPSGTMANQIAVRAHTEPGDEILVDANAHLYYYEAGGSAALSGVICRTLNGKRGIFTADDVQNALRPSDQHFAPTRLLCLENTHNRGGGSLWSIDAIDQVAQLARENDLKIHLDGARLWNATAATGIAENQYASHFDSVSVCFSKGLGAPVGSALAGGAEFITRARRFRKQFGGGMRQAGVLAAAALYALDHHRQLLAQDHQNARAIAAGLAEIAEVQIDIESVETNIVMFTTPIDAPQLAKALHDAGVYVLATGPRTIRIVTSLAVSNDDIASALKIIEGVLSEISAAA